MRVLIQRVSSASVTVEGVVSGAIERGLLVFLGVGKGDTRAHADYLVDKIVHLRIFRDEDGKMNRDVIEANGSLLVVSQFTLYASIRKGRRPSFDAAAPPAEAQALYEYFVAATRAKGIGVQTGLFQADMKVGLVNDGPVTIYHDTVDKFET
ncbi:MAG: D-tyrosyl-tRNA(Tyr) deacylase [Acidobacteria bacterium]|nr:D-tyrosyl-tRNA(Tyr) deacylase [Acidobacteriota bacterium]